MTEPLVLLPAEALCCPALGVPTMSEAEADEVVVLLKALADPVRLRLVNLIASTGEACACDLPEALDRSQPTISHHLKVLVEAGLLDREQRGKWAWFRVRPERVHALGRLFHVEGDGQGTTISSSSRSGDA